MVMRTRVPPRAMYRGNAFAGNVLPVAGLIHRLGEAAADLELNVGPMQVVTAWFKAIAAGGRSSYIAALDLVREGLVPAHDDRRWRIARAAAGVSVMALVAI